MTFRQGCLLLAFISAYGFLVLAYFPRVPPEDLYLVTEGRASSFDVCNSRSCRNGLSVGSVRFTCGEAHLVWTSYTCPTFLENEPIRLYWFKHQTLLGVENVVMRIEVRGVPERTYTDQKVYERTLWNSVLLDLPLLALTFFAITRTSFFKRTASDR